MKQLVSILIPAYNSEKWIEDSINSAISQTWPRKEIIVVDDGSSDSTLERAQSFASSWIKVASQDNMGASSARNHALELAQGDYIQWLDADDLLTPGKIKAQLDNTVCGTESKVLLSGSWGRFYYDPEKTIFKPDALWQDLSPADWLHNKIDGNLWLAIESWLVSRRLTEMAGPWNESLKRDNDGEYFTRVISCSDGIRFVPSSKSLVRRSSPGISHNTTLNEEKLNSILTSLFFHIEALRKLEDTPRTRKASLKLLNRWAIYFYPERKDLYIQMNQLAADLGGELATPSIGGKYWLVESLLGLGKTKKIQYRMSHLKAMAEAKLKRFF